MVLQVIKNAKFFAELNGAITGFAKWRNPAAV
jgi:hypothetical protein